MKKYIVRYNEGQQEQVREFASKVDAFRWFNWECPADEAFLQELSPSGDVSPPKTLRRRK